jgi:hypothetical protein
MLPRQASCEPWVTPWREVGPRLVVAATARSHVNEEGVRGIAEDGAEYRGELRAVLPRATAC